MSTKRYVGGTKESHEKAIREFTPSVKEQLMTPVQIQRAEKYWKEYEENLMRPIEIRRQKGKENAQKENLVHERYSF